MIILKWNFEVMRMEYAVIQLVDYGLTVVSF